VLIVGGLGVVLLVLFVVVERRAAEPIVPPVLMRNRVFAVGGSLSLIVGFALFGAVTFLPLYFQTVDGASPTGSGLRLIPLMAGVLTMSIFSGQMISRTGRYRVFPIIGTALMTAGLLLLSRLDIGTGIVASSLYLLVLGLGLGSTMQVLVMAVQNAVDFTILGAATSAVTLARGIGGSLGTAVFGTVFSTQLRSQLQGALSGPLAHEVAGGGRLTGAQVRQLPEAARVVYERAYVHALRPVFLMAAGVAAFGFALSLLLEERPLREAAAASTGLEDSLAAPRSSDSLAEVERALTKVTTFDERARFRQEVAQRAGVDISPGAIWALVRIDEHGQQRAKLMAEEDGVDPDRIDEVVGELRERKLLAGEPGDAELTAAGRDYTDRVVGARRELLSEALADDSTRRSPELSALLQRLARELCGEPPVAVGAQAS
jgi:MFS family permease